MDPKKAIGLVITTYEGGNNPVLSHIFWGKTLQEAVGIAKSHLITDYFFSASFEGEMEWPSKAENGRSWKLGVLKLSNELEIIPTDDVSEELDQVYKELDDLARHYNTLKEDSGMVDDLLNVATSS